MIQPIFRHRTAAVVGIIIGIACLCVFMPGLKAANKTSANTAAIASNPDVKQVAGANTGFGFRLLHKLTQAHPEGNIFFSPFSISNALTMTLNGAGGQTRRDMASTLGLASMTQNQINHANGLLLPSLENPDPKVELSAANALWANIGTNFNADFQKRCRTFYNARTDTLNFGSPAAADLINAWVKSNTNGKIDQLVSAFDLAGSEMVLTNAVYFHGQWSHEFEKSATQYGPFTLALGTTKIVPLMSQERYFPYLETPQFQAVSLPYGNGRMSLYVFLPKPGTTLADLVTGMNANSWDGWVGKMHPTDITIILPRFKADYQTTLNSSLSDLGMGSAFGPGADFAPMGLQGLVISKVIHKAIIEVNEEGTVATAATGVIGTLGAQLILTTIRVDHPFFCAIRDNATGTMLFEGVIRDPQ